MQRFSNFRMLRMSGSSKAPSPSANRTTAGDKVAPQECTDNMPIFREESSEQMKRWTLSRWSVAIIRSWVTKSNKYRNKRNRRLHTQKSQKWSSRTIGASGRRLLRISWGTSSKCSHLSSCMSSTMSANFHRWWIKLYRSWIRRP